MTMQFLSQARCVCVPPLVNKVYCTDVSCEWVSCLQIEPAKKATHSGMVVSTCLLHPDFQHTTWSTIFWPRSAARSHTGTKTSANTLQDWAKRISCAARACEQTVLHKCVLWVGVLSTEGSCMSVSLPYMLAACIELKKIQACEPRASIMSSSHSKVVVDHEGDLSSS